MVASVVEVIKTTEIQTQCWPYYLDKRELFLCYTMTNLHVCNLQGDILFTFPEIHILRNTLYYGPYITRAQDILICKSDTYIGAVDVLNIVTGEHLAKIETDNSHSSEIREAAVRCMSSLAYDERTREIFTGNIFGICCRWSNRILEDIGDRSKYSLH